MRVGLLSGQVFCLLVNFDSRRVTGAALLPECVAANWLYGGDPGGSSPARLGCQSELGAAALLKAVWWGMRLASLLTHLF